jgi:hypothetical protein
MGYKSKEALQQLTKLTEDFSNHKINEEEANETLLFLAKTFYNNNIFQYVYEYMQSEKLVSTSYKDNAEDKSYVDDIAIGDYVYKEAIVEIKHMLSKEKLTMYRIYKVAGSTNSMLELAPITKNIKVLPGTEQELLNCTSPFEAFDNNFVHKRDKAELHKLILRHD